PCKEVHDPRRSLVRTEADENHARWLSEDAVRIRVLSAIPVREVLDLVCAATTRVLLDQSGELTVVHPRQVGGVVQDLRDSVPCERRALQLEDHQPADLIDADQVEWTASGRKLPRDDAHTVQKRLWRGHEQVLEEPLGIGSADFVDRGRPDLLSRLLLDTPELDSPHRGLRIDITNLLLTSPSPRPG